MNIVYQNADGSEYISEGPRYINVSKEECELPNYKKRKLPVMYTRKEECCGCSACYTVCPRSDKGLDYNVEYTMAMGEKPIAFPLTGAISLLPDEEGFLYPVVDASLCVRCYKCLSVCPYK